MTTTAGRTPRTATASRVDSPATTARTTTWTASPTATTRTFIWTDADGKKRRSGVDQTVDFNGDGLNTVTAVANIDTANADGDPEDCANSSSSSTLTGHDDWSNIKLPFRMAAASDSAPVTPEDHRELRADEIERIERALNSTDLAVLVDDSVDPTGAGEALAYTLTARNVGVNPTAAASLRMTIPSCLTLVSAPGCFLSPDLLTCDVGFLDAGAERAFTATFDIAADLVHVAGGPVTLNANATIKNAAGSDPVASNDAVTESTLVVAKADLVHLGAAMGGVPSELLIGDVAPVTLTEAMTQLGPSSPMDVRVTRIATAAAGSSIALAETSVVVPALMKGETRGAFEDHDASHGGADAVMHFAMEETGLSDGEPQACVKGRFTDENGNVFKFFGCDDLRWAGK